MGAAIARCLPLSVPGPNRKRKNLRCQPTRSVRDTVWQTSVAAMTSSPGSSPGHRRPGPAGVVARLRPQPSVVSRLPASPPSAPPPIVSEPTVSPPRAPQLRVSHLRSSLRLLSRRLLSRLLDSWILASQKQLAVHRLPSQLPPRQAFRRLLARRQPPVAAH